MSYGWGKSSCNWEFCGGKTEFQANLEEEGKKEEKEGVKKERYGGRKDGRKVGRGRKEEKRVRSHGR